MVSVKLSEKAQFSRFPIVGTDGLTEITRDDACSVPSGWAIIRLSDPNFLFTFEESDRKFLSELEGKILDIALRELKIEGSASDVEVALLGAKAKTSSVKSKVSKVASKVATPKPKKETVKSDDS
tara:strand:+ start:871 stop:1245 length:375 start_codon:yes stop_codon:yes gene_type:complete